MQTCLQIVQRAAYGLLVISASLLIVGAAGLVVLHAHHERLLSVQTASMVPTFRPGDALVVEPAQPLGLHVGDIVSYRSPRWAGLTISHRIVAIDRNTGWLTTAGDALGSPDPSFPPSQVLGRAIAIAPGLGRVIDFFRRPIGLVVAVYLPALLAIIAEVRRLAQSYAHPFYSARL